MMMMMMILVKKVNFQIQAYRLFGILFRTHTNSWLPSKKTHFMRYIVLTLNEVTHFKVLPWHSRVETEEDRNEYVKIVIHDKQTDKGLEGSGSGRFHQSLSRCSREDVRATQTVGLMQLLRFQRYAVRFLPTVLIVMLCISLSISKQIDKYRLSTLK
jgi:hypothetical protein